MIDRCGTWDVHGRWWKKRFEFVSPAHLHAFGVYTTRINKIDPFMVANMPYYQLNNELWPFELPDVSR